MLHGEAKIAVVIQTPNMEEHEFAVYIDPFSVCKSGCTTYGKLYRAIKTVYLWKKYLKSNLILQSYNSMC